MACAIPSAIVTTLRTPAPTAAEFVPTKFTPADSKAWFAIHILRFALADFPSHLSEPNFPAEPPASGGDAGPATMVRPSPSLAA